MDILPGISVKFLRQLKPNLPQLTIVSYTNLLDAVSKATIVVPASAI
jgi:hypothetical protein